MTHNKSAWLGEGIFVMFGVVRKRPRTRRAALYRAGFSVTIVVCSRNGPRKSHPIVTLGVDSGHGMWIARLTVIVVDQVETWWLCLKGIIVEVDRHVHGDCG